MSDVIREFLVSLGFETKDQEKFDKALDWSQAKAIALGEAMYDVAKQVVAAIADMAVGFDDLYWQSQRLGSSATDIRAYGYAMSQLGGSVKGANSALENIAEFAKSSPGASNWLVGALGVDPRHIGDAEAMARDLAHAFSKMPYYRARVYASQLGIDPIQLQAMERDTGKYEARYKEMARNVGQIFGVNLDQSTQQGKDFMNGLRDLRAEFELFFMALSSKALEYLVPKLQQFAEWVKDMMSDKQLPGMSGTFKEILKDSTDLLKALENLANSPAIQRLGRAFADATDQALKGLVHLVNMVTAILNGDWATAKAEAVALYGNTAGAAVAAHGGITNLVAGSINGMIGAGPAQLGKGEVKQNAQGAYAFFRSQGFTDDQAKGITAALYSESHLNPNAVNPTSGATGLGQWLTARRIDFAKLFGHNLSQSTFTEQLQFVMHELRGKESKALKAILKANGAAMVASEFIDKYERPGFLGGIADNFRASAFLMSDPFKATLTPTGQKSVVVNQKTEIHAHGGDSKEVANTVTDQQDAVNQRMAGNFAVTVR